jgi:SAM-dependent methyltransferase
MVDRIRLVAGTARYLWYVRIRRHLRTLPEEGLGVTPRTVSHNLSALKDRAVARSSKLVRPLSVIETLGPESKILSIGPRTEGELLNLVGHGFRPDHVRGVDLISYSPWVDLGNMHDLPYADDSFDATIMSFVLSYSSERQRAVSEMVRVTRNEGLLALGVEWNPLSDEEIEARYGYNVGGANRIESVEEMLAYFGDHVGHVYFHHPVHPRHLDRVNSLCVIFELTK